MAGQRDDQSSVSTSIALLQERFRQLQKMREKREEREHHRLIYPEPDQHTMPTPLFEHAKMNFQKDPTFPSRTPQQNSSPVSLGLELYNKHANIHSWNNMSSTNLWSDRASPAEKTARSPSCNYDKWDVDTSLHL